MRYERRNAFTGEGCVCLRTYRAMADNSWIQELVARVVSQVLQSQVPALRDELVTRVLQELQPGFGSSANTPKQLLGAIGAVRQAESQKEILSALLDGASQ